MECEFESERILNNSCHAITIILNNDIIIFV